MEAMLASMLGAGDGGAAAAAGGSSVAGAGKDGATPADSDEAGQPSMEDLMALLQMYEKNPQDAPPELGELLKAVRQQKGEATATDKQAEGQDIVPEPGFVIKTVDDKGGKVFINICGSDKVAPPGARWVDGQVPEEVQRALDQGDEADEAAQQALRCPISLGEPRVDMDRKGEACTVFDCVFNDEVASTASKGHRQLKNFIIELALGWIQHKHKVVLDPKYKLPRMRYKGEHVESMRIRVDKKALVEEVAGGGAEEEEEAVFPLVTKPIPATVARPPKNADVAVASSASGEGVGGGAGRLAHSLDFVGRPAVGVELRVRTPEGGAALDAGSLVCEVGGEQCYVSARGYAPLAVRTPFFVAAEGGEVLLDARKGELLITLPFRPFQSVLEQMRKEAPHKFGELGLSSDAYLELEP